MNSTTYWAVHEQGGEHAALTVIDTPALALGSYTRRILSTAQILTRIDHPGVVSIVDVGLVADGRPYFVTELDEGVTLAERVQDTIPMEQRAAVTVLRGICAALMAAHEVGVVHGSLDLDHVFLTEGDERFVKLLDWGVEHAVFDEARRSGIEPAMNECCTAPEQVFGIVSPQTDAYALGIVACQLLLGRAPVDEGALHGACATHSIPPSLAALLRELLAPDPRARLTVRGAADRLGAVARDLEPPAAMPSPVDDELLSGLYAKSRVPQWVSALVSAAAICAVLSVFVIRRDKTPSAPAAQANAAPVVSPATPQPEAMPAPKVTAVVTAAPQHAPPAIGVATRQQPPLQAREAQRAPRPKPATGRTAAAETNSPVDDVRSELLTQYQRIGHDLIELRKLRGAAAVADLWQRFDSLEIHHALATTKARAEAAATLGELRVKIDRNKAVQPSAECLQNPLADGCR